MRTVGRRQEALMTLYATGEQLAAGARFSESIARLRQAGIIPKGVSRFKTHEEANRHWDLCLARCMAALVATRPSHD
jgi:phage FluMu gp28-like protein